MAYASAACLMILVGPLGRASASLACDQDAKAESCALRAEGSKGMTAQESVLLQRERGTTGKTRVHSALSAAADLPTLPAPFTPEVALAVDAWSGSGDGPSLSFQQGESPSAAELQHFELLKDMRKRGHRCPGGRSFAAIPDTDDTFLFDCRLWAAARFWSSEMGQKNFFSHVRGSSTPCSRTSDYGLPACGENIAAGNGDPAGSLQQFMESDGHCVNMMEPRYNRFGAGYVQTPAPPSTYTHYWTQAMGTSSARVDQSCLANAPSSGTAPSPSPSATPEACEDLERDHCDHYKGLGYCDTVENIKKQCRATCGLCTPTIGGGGGSVPSPVAPSPPQTSSGDCYDTEKNHCAYYRSQNWCNTPNVKKACQQTCGFCR